MKTTSILMAALAGTAMAIPNTKAAQAKKVNLQAFNAPQAVSMEVLRERKVKQHERDVAKGAFRMNAYKAAGATACVDGYAGEYKCNNIDLKGFIRHQDMQSRTRIGNDVWGWTSATGREFAIVGQTDGTAFVEVLKDGSLQYMGRLPTQTVASTWRDAKVIGNYVYIGSEAANHGLQIWDLRQLLTVDPAKPVTFPLSSQAATFLEFGSSHNIVANEETQTIFAVGTPRNGKCRAGLWMVDVSNPNRPQDSGCVSSDGYVHDAQCVIYWGPHAQYQGREICFNFNEDALTIVDVTRHGMPVQLSRTTYRGATYTHQGWLADPQMRYLLLDDELDEQYKSGEAADQHTTTYIVDITDLTWPVFRGVYKSPVVSIDHNQYVVDGISYQANYGSGLRMVNVSTVALDDTGSLFEEVGFFDVRPEDDDLPGGGEATFNGAWSVYPYFKSGHIVVNSIERGLFSLKYSA